MTHCQCQHPVSGPGTLTDYADGATVYRLCRDCGLPILATRLPERLHIQGKRQAAMKATAQEG